MTYGSLNYGLKSLTDKIHDNTILLKISILYKHILQNNLKE